jgi:hypothetical protein
VLGGIGSVCTVCVLPVSCVFACEALCPISRDLHYER